MKLLELFAGSRCIGRAAEELGYNVFSVDWTDYEGINLQIDIGKLKIEDVPFMQEFNRHTVWYCQYGDDRAKPTDIWTNSTTWIPRKECCNYKYNEAGEIINKHCHHESARRGAKTGTQGRQDSYNRSKIPHELCKEIIKTTLR